MDTPNTENHLEVLDWALSADLIVRVMQDCTRRDWWSTYCAFRGTCKRLAAIKLNVRTELTLANDWLYAHTMFVNDQEIGSIWSMGPNVHIKWQWHSERVYVHHTQNLVDIEQYPYRLQVCEDKISQHPYRYVAKGIDWVPRDALKTLTFMREPSPNNSAEVLWESFWALCGMAAPPEVVMSAREQMAADGISI